jgi:uncharacterized phage protein gp47/JayE
MPFDRPSLSELAIRAISDIQTRVTGASTLLRRSVLRVLAKVQAGANHLLYGYILVSSLGANKIEQVFFLHFTV